MRAVGLKAWAIGAGAVALLCGLAFADGRDGADNAARRAARRLEAAEAAREIRATYLFTDGRGMHSLPGLYGGFRAAAALASGPTTAILRHDLGLVVDGEGVAGLHEVSVRGVSVPVLGCAVCHTGRAAGRTFVGLGNKNIDVARIGHASLDLTLLPRLAAPLQGAEARRLTDQAVTFSRLVTDPRVANATQGLVPTAIVATWFLRAGDPCTPPQSYPGAVKVPHLWGYGEKRVVGTFCDGIADGRGSVWIAMTEAAAGQRPETLRAVLPRVQALEAQMTRLLPPRYPFPVDPAGAARGAAVFARACAGCHGEYPRDDDGFPRFAPPRHVPWEEVGTDGERLRVRTPELYAGIDTSPLADLVRRTDLAPGYFAPRLEGIWARFPYLHNASVPTLAALLEPEARRPRAWSVRDAGEAWRFDARAVGLTVTAPGTPASRRLLNAARYGARNVYVVTRPGQSNRGHPFGTDLQPQEKQDLIEYLKTL